MWLDLQVCSQCIARKKLSTHWDNLASCFEYTRCRELRGGSCLYFISSPCVSRYGAYLVWRMTSRVHLDPHYSITRVWVGRQMFALVDLGTVEPASHVYPHPPPPPSSPLIYKSHWHKCKSMQLQNTNWAFWYPPPPLNARLYWSC